MDQEQRLRLCYELEHEQWDLAVDDLYRLYIDKEFTSSNGGWGWSDRIFKCLIGAFYKLTPNKDKYLWEIFQFILEVSDGSEEQYHILLSVIEENFGYIANDLARFLISEWLGGCRDTRSLSIIEKWLNAQPTKEVKDSLFNAIINYTIIPYRYEADPSNKAKALILLHDFFGFDVDEKGALVESQSV
ncbi:hypothetical protein [Thiofilum flexile]|uniref:hypothetical protein n=1 Tax=Thiofilum flexile TaxID=125627 RepID=UPI0013A5583C|nr:hypothetical protein [Thiofilum flexile]